MEPEPAPNLAGYRLSITPCENEAALIPPVLPPPVWIPIDSLSDPNHPFYSWQSSDEGVYTLVLTAVDEDGNEGASSSPVSLGVQVEIPLSIGQNLVSYPIQPPFIGYPCDLWLNDLGPETRSLQIYLPQTLTYNTAYWSGENIKGSIFPIVQDGGYIIYRQRPGHLTWSGLVQNQPVSLQAGRNVVGIPLLFRGESGLDFFRDLVKNGDPVSSTHFYQSSDGRWESIYGFFGQISGRDTKMKKGMGCLVEVGGE